MLERNQILWRSTIQIERCGVYLLLQKSFIVAKFQKALNNFFNCVLRRRFREAKQGSGNLGRKDKIT